MNSIDLVDLSYYDELMSTIWKKLTQEDRRNLRTACRPLKAHCNACVTSTTVSLIPGQSNGDDTVCRAQIFAFSFLKHLTIRCEHRDMGLFSNRTLLKMLITSPRLKAIFRQLLTLTIVGSRMAIENTPNSVPIPTLPSSFNVSLRRLSLNSVELEAGSLACLSSSSSLKSIDLKFVSFLHPTAVKELGQLNSLKAMKLDTCSMRGFPLDLFHLTQNLKLLQRMELTHIDDMCGGLEWRASLGAVVGQLTSLICIRLDAGEYGTVMETEFMVDEAAHKSFNIGLAPMFSASNLQSFAADFLLKDDGWLAASKLPKLKDVIVEGVALSRPMPLALEALEDLTMNKATPAQMCRFLPLPALRRLHILFINCSAESREELAMIEADLFVASRLLRDTVEERKRVRAQSALEQQQQPNASLASVSNQQQAALDAAADADVDEVLLDEDDLNPLHLPPFRGRPAADDDGLEIVAGFRLVCNHALGAPENNNVFSHGKQIGAGALCRSLRPLDRTLRTLSLQNMFVSKRDLSDLTQSLPNLHDLCLVTCCLEPMALQCLHPLDLSLRRLSFLYGCSVAPHSQLTAAQTVAYCIAAASNRLHAIASNPSVSPNLNLEMSLDNMALFDQQEVKRCLQPYAELLQQGRFKFVFMHDHDLIMQAAFQGMGAAGMNIMMQGLPNMENIDVEDLMAGVWDEEEEEEEEEGDFVVV